MQIWMNAAVAAITAARMQRAQIPLDTLIAAASQDTRAMDVCARV